MASLKLRRIVCSAPESKKQLARLREQLTVQSDVVTPANRKITQAVFGEALPPSRVVERVCNDVKANGLKSVLHYTEAFDKIKLTAATIRVPEAELKAAHAAASPEFLETVRRIQHNILAFQVGILHTDAELRVSGSHELQLRYRPMRRVGVYAPGGSAVYPSSILMTVVPAQAASVKEIVVVMPPGGAGQGNATQYAVCWELGVREVYRLGGAQAIAALAYGVEGLPAVDMIVGPGSAFVALAKKYVSGTVAIDCIAGPSEVVVLADETARAGLHRRRTCWPRPNTSPGASVLVTPHESVLDRGDVAGELRPPGGEIVARRTDADVPGADSARMVLAGKTSTRPSRLTNKPWPRNTWRSSDRRRRRRCAERIDNAGAIFVGPWTPVAVGDYAAGPSHVLPTGGTARFSGGLCSNDFLKRSSVIQFTKTGLKEIADDVRVMAEKEGLTAHAASVAIRVDANVSLPARPRPKKPEQAKK